MASLDSQQQGHKNATPEYQEKINTTMDAMSKEMPSTCITQVGRTHNFLQDAISKEMTSTCTTQGGNTHNDSMPKEMNFTCSNEGDNTHYTGGLLQRQGSRGQSSPRIAGLTKRCFNSTFHQSTSYPYLGGEYNLSNMVMDGASQPFNMQGSSSIHQGTSSIAPPISSNIPPTAATGDLVGKSTMGASYSDYENLWLYSQQQKATNPMSSILNNEFGLSLNSDTLVNGPMATSPGTGISLPGETSGRQNQCGHKFIPTFFRH